MSSTIPNISLLDLDLPSSIDLLKEAFEQVGFVVITEHGISKVLTDRFLNMFKEFFSWPDVRKMNYQLANAGGARGYTPFGVETAKDSEHVDLKEFWHIGRELDAGHPMASYMPQNLWIEAIEGFRSTSLELYAAFDHVGRQLLRAIAKLLELVDDFFEDKVDVGNSVLRVIHYPPLPASPTPSLRAGAHEDINVITLLLGAEEPGLQICTRSGAWLAVNPGPGSMVVNVGDMLQRLTNGVLRSTSHRVVNPTRDRASSSRYATPFFLHFNSNYLIQALPSCCGDGRAKPPPPILADDYLQERLREIRLK